MDAITLTISPAAKTRLHWGPILEEAAAIVNGYTTAVTLRQLYYRLVAAQLIPNNQNAYTSLSRNTARARREGRFPRLIDLGRQVDRPLAFSGPGAAREWLSRFYRRDRTEGQPVAIYLGVEKGTLLGLLESWFGDRGIPRVALRGYSSQTLVDDVVDQVTAEVARDVERHRRPAVLIYCGDYDPSGVDIPRDFVARTGCFDRIVRVAVNPDQISALGLIEAPAKSGDARRRSTGVSVQVEVEAIPPDQLEAMVRAAVDDFWDPTAFQRALDRERRDLEAL
jgi:hypothetical protein